MDKLRIGFVGVGGMGQCAHLRNYVTLPDCEVVALAEIREGLGKLVGERYGVPHVYKTHEEMLAKESLDGIVASQQFCIHGALVPELLASGVPVFTEKPLAGSVEMGAKIVKAVEDSDNWVMVGYHKRSDPASMYAKAEIDRLKSSGELGKLKYVRILMPAGDWTAQGFSVLIQSDEPYPPIEWDPAPSDMDTATYEAYVSFVNYYIHQVNFMRYLLGEDYRVSYADPSGVLLVSESDSGVPGVIEMTPYQTTIDWQESALVAFENGWIKLNLPAPVAYNRPGTVEIFRDPGNGVVPETVVPQMPWIHAMKQQATNFLSAIRGEMAPMCVAQDALKDLQVARDYIRLVRNG